MTYSFDYFSPQANSHASWIDNGMSYCFHVKPFIWLWKTYSCQCLNWYTNTVYFISFQYDIQTSLYHTRTIYIVLPIYLAHMINIIDGNLPSQNHILTLWINAIPTIHILWYLWLWSFGWTLSRIFTKWNILSSQRLKDHSTSSNPNHLGWFIAYQVEDIPLSRLAFTCHITR